VSDGRSTLLIRLENNGQFKVTPGCNIDVFPINSIQAHPKDSYIVSFSEVDKKVPFPPMPLREIRKLLDFRQVATHKQIKSAINLAECDSIVLQGYEERLKNKQVDGITVKQLVDDLNPKA
jgi:hypothetical protein